MYQIPELRKFPKLFHAFSTKDDGNMANSILGKSADSKKVLKNREKFLNKIGVDIGKCVCMWVVHGHEIIKVPKKSVGVSMNDYKQAVKVDGLMTNKKGIYLFLLVADCLPIILYDPKKEVLSLVHAGWKGVDLEIAGKVVIKMQEEYANNPKEIIAGIGPCAHKESFIKEYPNQKDDIRWEPFLKKINRRKYEVDLLGFIKKHLLDAGVLSTNIHKSSIDTVKDKRFFSHVRECSLPIEKQGRFACVVGLI